MRVTVTLSRRLKAGGRYEPVVACLADDEGELAEEVVAAGVPVLTGLLRHKWHNTPNIRFFSIADFEDYCREKSARIHRLVALNTETRQDVTDNPNLHADLAIFVISRP